MAWLEFSNAPERIEPGARVRPKRSYGIQRPGGKWPRDELLWAGRCWMPPAAPREVA